MNTTHLDDSILQQIAIDNMEIPSIVMEHYKSCITCRKTSEKYAFMLDQLAHEQRPTLSVKTSHMILACLPPAKRNTKKSYGVILMVCGGLLVWLSIFWYLFKEVQKELSMIASAGAMLIFAVIVINEIADRINKYQRKIAMFKTI